MKKTSYSTFTEWQSDHERIKASPDDKHLMAYVVKCIQNSPRDIQQQIKDFLTDAVLETNPWEIFHQVSKANPHCFMLVKSRHDPWFSV